MTAQITKPLPLNIVPHRKTDVRTQFAALCWRIKNRKVQVLLITSRRTKSWIIPKGWPIPEKSPGASAMTEAWEEAGVQGVVDERPLGVFSYLKDMDSDDGLPCVAMVYGLRVKSLAKVYPEMNLRKRKWVSCKRASTMVNAPELARILRDFDPRKMH